MDDIWKMERRLWLEGIEAYADLMAPECVMAFGPMGVLEGQAIIDSLRDAPRWSDVVMSAQVLKHPSGDVAVLAYQAEGNRDAASPYRALCTSTYLRLDSGWRIVQHQQTPLPESGAA